MNWLVNLVVVLGALVDPSANKAYLSLCQLGVILLSFWRHLKVNYLMGDVVYQGAPVALPRDDGRAFGSTL